MGVSRSNRPSWPAPLRLPRLDVFLGTMCRASTTGHMCFFYELLSGRLVFFGLRTRLLRACRRPLGNCQCSRGGGLKIMYSTYPVTCRCGERCFRSLSWPGLLRSALRGGRLPCSTRGGSSTAASRRPPVSPRQRHRLLMRRSTQKFNQMLSAVV